MAARNKLQQTRRQFIATASLAAFPVSILANSGNTNKQINPFRVESVNWKHNVRFHTPQHWVFDSEGSLRIIMGD